MSKAELHTFVMEVVALFYDMEAHAGEQWDMQLGVILNNHHITEAGDDINGTP